VREAEKKGLCIFRGVSLRQGHRTGGFSISDGVVLCSLSSGLLYIDTFPLYCTVLRRTRMRYTPFVPALLAVGPVEPGRIEELLTLLLLCLVCCVCLDCCEVCALATSGTRSRSGNNRFGVALANIFKCNFRIQNIH